MGKVLRYGMVMMNDDRLTGGIRKENAHVFGGVDKRLTFLSDERRGYYYAYEERARLIHHGHMLSISYAREEEEGEGGK